MPCVLGVSDEFHRSQGAGFAAIGAVAITPVALPPLPPNIEDYYAASPEHTKYVAMYRTLEGDHKCDVCHKPDLDKKAKGHALNDYGEAVHKHFNRRDFNEARHHQLVIATLIAGHLSIYGIAAGDWLS